MVGNITTQSLANLVTDPDTVNGLIAVLTENGKTIQSTVERLDIQSQTSVGDKLVSEEDIQSVNVLGDKAVALKVQAVSYLMDLKKGAFSSPEAFAQTVSSNSELSKLMNESLEVLAQNGCKDPEAAQTLVSIGSAVKEANAYKVQAVTEQMISLKGEAVTEVVRSVSHSFFTQSFGL